MRTESGGSTPTPQNFSGKLTKEFPMGSHVRVGTSVSLGMLDSVHCNEETKLGDHLTVKPHFLF